MSKPSDLIPELQGRFPIRVELTKLSTDDFVKILIEPDNALIKQYMALLATEGIEIEFSDEAIRKIAEIAIKLIRIQIILEQEDFIRLWRSSLKIYRLKHLKLR